MSSLLPFLYQTRTILRSTPRGAIAFYRTFHVTQRRLGRGDEIPFASEIGEEDIPLERTPARPSTITPTERQVFERIFADIKARGLKPSVQGDGPPVEPTQSSRSAMLIMQQAAHDMGQARPPAIVSPAIRAGVSKDRNKALLRFPPELRAAASKALDTIESSATSGAPQARGDFPLEDSMTGGDDLVEEGWKTSAHTMGRTFELEAKRYPERTRVEGLIAATETDFELWDVLEEEVFTMPAKLGISEPSIPAKKPKKKKKQSKEKRTQRKRANKKKGLPVEEAADDADAPQKLSLYIHGPLYPAYLLLALRRLDTAFRTPSPFVFSILPRVKELGLESYVLGVSTPFYNELLDIYWTRRGNLPGMLDLLEEMRQCGLYFDQQTASILNRAHAAVTGLATEAQTNFAKGIMSMPEYERSNRDRLAHWHRAVDISLEERKEDIGY